MEVRGMVRVDAMRLLFPTNYYIRITGPGKIIPYVLSSCVTVLNVHLTKAFFNFDKLHLRCKVAQKNCYYILNS